MGVVLWKFSELCTERLVQHTDGCGLFGRTGSNLLPTGLQSYGHVYCQSQNVSM